MPAMKLLLDTHAFLWMDAGCLGQAEGESMPVAENGPSENNVQS